MPRNCSTRIRLNQWRGVVKRYRPLLSVSCNTRCMALLICLSSGRRVAYFCSVGAFCSSASCCSSRRLSFSSLTRICTSSSWLSSGCSSLSCRKALRSIRLISFGFMVRSHMLCYSRAESGWPSSCTCRLVAGLRGVIHTKKISAFRGVSDSP